MHEHKWILLLSKGQLSDVAWHKIKQVTDSNDIILEDLTEKEPLSGEYKRGDNLREYGKSKARYIMSKNEFEICRQFRKHFPENWLIKDGIFFWLLYGGVPVREPLNICVAKSFTTTQTFILRDGGKRKKQNIATLLRNLPPHNRTPVFEGYGGKIGFWYLRLRESTQLQFPLFGVIKIEIPNIGKQPITTEFIDELSSALLAEQFVTPYGSDDRWHTHLYPIYQAEQSAKLLFFSTEVTQGYISNAIRGIKNG